MNRFISLSYSVPAAFQAALTREFGDRLRIRWSLAKHEFHIEQRVGRAALAPFRIDERDDRFIRARDGYAFVMAVKAGTRVPCPTCGLDCRVPELHTGEIVCRYCESVRNQRGRQFGGYWPLSDILIDHLKRIDPYRDGHLKAVREQDLSRARHEMASRRDLLNTIEAGAKEDAYRLFATPRAYLNDATRHATA